MQKNFKKLLMFVCLAIAVLAVAHFALAANNVDVGLDYAEKTGLSSQDIRVTIAKVVRIVLGLLGIIAVGLIMYAGWMWMSSEGNEEKISLAKKILKNAIIGLIIIISAFAITSFIINKLIGATTGEFGAGGGPGGGGGIAALGNGIIESHYPARNQKDVPRNTKIVVTFKEPMDPSTLVKDEKINADNIFIFKTADGAGGPKVADVKAYKTDDNKTFVFKPVEYLGSSAEKIWYSAALSKNLKKANGDAAFGQLAGTIAYEWSFEAGTHIDVTPPKIESVIPIPASEEPRNVVIQINFSEAVDPIASSGASKSGFKNIVINNKNNNTAVDGNFYISNQYRTVEFLTEDACGTNSCGDTVYCLPANKDLSPLVKAATLATAGEGAASFPYDGIVDMADNSFDGNASGNAEGPEAQSGFKPFDANNISHEGEGDDYVWSFRTNDKIELTPPTIVNITPGIKEMGIKLDAIPEATFSRFLMSSSLTSSSIILEVLKGGELNYWISKSNNSLDRKSTAYLNHDEFSENSDYAPRFTGGIRDIYQNCYSPCSGLGVTGNPSCCNGAATKGGECK